MIPKKTIDLFKRIARVVAPPPKLTVSQWADKNRRLSSESSAEAGQWRTDRAPYQREIMDACSDPAVETVVVMSSAQVGKTEIILNSIGYYVDYDPAPMMLVQPTDEMAQSFSKDRLDPMFRDTPALKEKTAEAKSRDKNNTILHKRFQGGHLTMVGSNSPAKLASRPIRILFADEIDRYPPSAGQEGDPLNLAMKRTTTFWNRKHIFVSTPTVKGVSRIEKEYLSSTMEEWCLPCPECGEHQPLLWGQIIFDKHEDGTFELKGMACCKCGTISSELDWKSGSGKWIAKHPERVSKRGFHLNEFASPWKSWSDVIADFMEAKKSPETLKTWVNTSLGETWEEQGELDIDELLAKRRQYYGCEVPEPVVCLTCGVDTQDNRLEYEVVGWTKGCESYGIQYGVIMGDPGQMTTITDKNGLEIRSVWDILDDVLNKQYERSDGQKLQIMTTCVDSGGHFTSEVYAYCKAREMKRVWAIKGGNTQGAPYIQRPSKRNQAGAWLFTIGVDSGKDTITSRLQTSFEGPGFCHFPMEPEKGYNQQYFEGLTSERRVTHYVKGKAIIRWEKRSSGARNEPFDIRNYATAALEILNPPLDLLYKQLNEDPKNPEIAKKTAKKQVQNRVNAPRKRYGRVSKGIDF